MGMKEKGGGVATSSRGVCSVSEVAQAVDCRDWSGRQKRGGWEGSVKPTPAFPCQHTTHKIMKKFACLALNHSVKERKHFTSEIFWLIWEEPFRFSERDGVCTYAYEYFAVKKLFPVAHCFLSHTYVHAVAVLNRKRAPASSRGETKPQGTQRKPTRKYFSGIGGHRNETGMTLCWWTSSCCWWSLKRPNGLKKCCERSIIDVDFEICSRKDKFLPAL